MPIMCIMVRGNHEMVREKSGKSQGILWGLMAGHPVIVNWTHGSNFLWYFNWNRTIFIKQNKFKYIKCPPFCFGLNMLKRVQVDTHLYLITLTSRHLISPASQLFVQQFVLADFKGNFKASHQWLFLSGIHRWPVVSPLKGPLLRKAFPCHYIILSCCFFSNIS